LSSSGGIFDLAGLQRRFDELDKRSQDPALWNDREAAGQVLRERSSLESQIRGYGILSTSIADLEVYLEMARGGEPEAFGEFARIAAALDAELAEMQLRRMLSGEYDRNNAIVTVKPGAGGTESQDWAEMLLRMYLRWAERRGFEAKILEYQPGDGAGIKSCTFSIIGEFAYGYMRSEAGIHRLVRISPFDNQGRRHTSFSSVHPLPELDDDIEVDIDETELRIDTYRSSGAGGQHVNKTDSAVRLTHLPSGIVVACQNERSQHKNKAMAMKILRARLYELEKQKHQDHLDSIGPAQRDNAFGHQIRSYVLQPYRMVKDLRTGVEIGNTDAVLDGDIDEFIQAFLIAQCDGPPSAKSA
jgi:peptide chain release factor 2